MRGILGATAFGIPALVTVQPVLQAHTAVGFVKWQHWMQCVKPRAGVPCLGNRMDEHLAPPCLLFLSLISKSQRTPSQNHCLPITALHKWSRLSTLVLNYVLQLLL